MSHDMCHVPSILSGLPNRKPHGCQHRLVTMCSKLKLTLLIVNLGAGLSDTPEESTLPRLRKGASTGLV